MAGQWQENISPLQGVGPAAAQQTPKRKVKAKLREDRQPASRPNDVWAMDFLHDQLFDGRKIRILAVIDTFSRFSPALDPRFAYKAHDVVETLDRAGKVVGYPKTIRVDNGPEFVSRDLDLWAYQRGVTLDFSRPGKPTDNAFAESFNGKVRAECLNTAGSCPSTTPVQNARLGVGTIMNIVPTARLATSARSS